MHVLVGGEDPDSADFATTPNPSTNRVANLVEDHCTELGSEIPRNYDARAVEIVARQCFEGQLERLGGVVVAVARRHCWAGVLCSRGADGDYSPREDLVAAEAVVKVLVGVRRIDEVVAPKVLKILVGELEQGHQVEDRVSQVERLGMAAVPRMGGVVVG